MGDETSTIKALYAAFRQADMRGILELLADDVAWEHWDEVGNSAQQESVPWFVRRTGTTEVPGFRELAGLRVRELPALAFMVGDGHLACSPFHEAPRMGQRDCSRRG